MRSCKEKKLKMDDISISMDVFQGWHFHPWMRFLHPWMGFLFVRFLVKIVCITFFKWEFLSMKFQFSCYLKKPDLRDGNSIHEWRNVIHGWRNVICGCHPWMEKCHPWMKVSSVDVIHGWRKLIHGWHPRMRMTDDGHGQSFIVHLRRSCFLSTV